MSKITVYAPNIGVENSKVIEVIVKVGDEINAEDSIIILESDKAVSEVPSSHTGKVARILVKKGDKISEGDPIIELESDAVIAEDEAQQPSAVKENDKATKEKDISTPANNSNTSQYDFEICVIGGGPGGYTAAFRAADLGLKVCLIERYDVLGGVCLNVGCIPSKALLHVAEIIDSAKQSSHFGVTFAKPKIDLNSIRKHKLNITNELNMGLAKMAKLRNIEVLVGAAHFKDKHNITLKQQNSEKNISFKSAIIAVGSSVTRLPFVPKHENVWDSTDALELRKIPKTMMILGGGIIGLEMATVYHALGTKITVVELGGQLIPEADKDSVMPLLKKIKGDYENIWLNTKATKIVANKTFVEVHLEGAKAPAKEKFDVVLVAVGRTPNGDKISAENAGITVTEQGFIEVDSQQKTNIPNIYAVGDVVGQPMLAHKATHQAKVAAEVIAGEASSFSPLSIPSVAYTHPEIAWVGKTEKQLKAEGIEYDKGLFPWQASGRALSSDAKDGISKAMFCKQSKRLLGASISGASAGELISEAILAMEMGADATDISLTIHPHPTLAETFAMASEMVDGSITDLLPPKPRK